MIRRLVPLVLAAGLAACNTSAGMFEDESDGREVDTNAFGSLLTMSGMLAAPKSPIEYGPRAPLAMPGTSELPAPEERSAALQAVDFPVDEDEQNTAAIDRASAGSRALDKRIKNSVGNNTNFRALPGDIEGTGTTREVAKVDRRDIDTESGGRKALGRDEMKVVVKNPSQAALLNEDGTAAPRASLAVPPGDYRSAAGGAPLPAEKDIENSDWISKELYRAEDKRPEHLRGTPMPASRSTNPTMTGVVPRG